MTRSEPRRPRDRRWWLFRLFALTVATWVAVVAGAGPGRGDDPRREIAVEMNPRIVGLDLDVSFDPATGYLEVLAELELEGRDVATFELGINPWMTVERSRASRGLIEHRKSDAGRIRVDLDPPLDGRNTLGFRITGRARRGNDPLVDEDRVVLGPSDGWYPMMPGTWADARVRVRVPEGWIPVAPGEPRPTASAGTWEWRTGRPVRSLALVAAPGLDLAEATAVRTTVRLAASNAGERVGTVAERLVDPLAWFSAALEPYAFDGFNVVLLPGLERRVQASGMIVVPAEVSLGGPADAADLLAGQWFGERLAGDGPWMQAFAAWYATMFARDRALDLPAEIAGLRKAYLEMSASRDVALSRAEARTPEAVLRGKGSAAPDMIRLAVGDRRARKAIEDLFRMPVSPPLTLEEIRSFYEKHAGETLLRAFADWFDRSGVPEFEARLRTIPASSGEWRADLTLVQIRGNYALPVEVVLFGEGKRQRETVFVDEETTSVFHILSFRPARVEIDPLGKIFRRDSE